jgi:ATP-dependent protease HslVU (ClpYQ) peptidase subunit
MTCIVGLLYKGKVYIGADSAGVDSNYNITTRKDPKVFKVGDFIIGFTTSFRMGQILQHSLKLPKPTKQEEKDIFKYMTTKFIEAVRRALKVGGFTKINSGNEVGGQFLVGYKGRLFSIESDFQVAESAAHFHAVGCGAEYALGSLHATFNTHEAFLPQPKTIIEFALLAASTFSAGVCKPFNILSEESQ